MVYVNNKGRYKRKAIYFEKIFVEFRCLEREGVHDELIFFKNGVYRFKVSESMNSRPIVRHA